MADTEPLFSSTDAIIQYVAFFCMIGSFITFFILLKKTPPGKRLYHAYTCGIVGFASVAYLFMAVGEGYIIVGEGQIFQYARYIDWFFTTPLLLLDLAGLAGASIEDQVILVILDVLMVLAGFAGAVAEDDVATGKMWLLGMLFFLGIVYDLVIVFPASARKVGDAAAKTYGQIMWLTVILWTAYPIVFFVTAFPHLFHGHVLSKTAEISIYCILDVVAKCVFGFILLFSHSAMEESFKPTLLSDAEESLLP